MKIPDKDFRVKVGCHQWDIKFKSAKDCEGYYGICRYNDQEIFIRENMSDTMKLETFLHEIVHSIDETYSLGLGEKKVHALGVHLATLILENPHVFTINSRGVRRSKGRKVSS